MADDPTVDNGALTDYIVSADECPGASGKYIQRMKLCYGADGDATMLTADANGLEVQLGAPIPAGTNNIGDVDVLSLPAIPAGTNNIGDVDIVSHPSHATATLANVSASVTSVTLQASNTARKGWVCWNDSTSVMYVKFGSTASTTSCTFKMFPDDLYEMSWPHYNGIITGIWVAAAGSARVTEIT